MSERSSWKHFVCKDSKESSKTQKQSAEQKTQTSGGVMGFKAEMMTESESRERVKKGQKQ